MTRRAARALASCLPLLAQAGCSTQLLRESGAALPAVAGIRAEFFPQREHQCGPAALATLLSSTGAAATPDALAHEVYIPGRQGSVQAEMLAATRRHGRVALVLEPQLAALLQELEHGHAVLVLQNFGLPSLPLWHYAVLVGYDRARDAVLVSGAGDRPRRLAARRFIGTWRRAGYWSFIALPPGGLPASARPARYLDAVAALEALVQPADVYADYQAAVGRWPAEPLAWFALANNRMAAGREPEAAAAYREVLRLQPGNLPARNNLALLLARRGCIDEASALLAPARDAARAAAGQGSFAAQIADSWHEIQALRATGAGCRPP
ncbi:MAG: PA2778 family cysteine peptidase [Gammaproteobacteria bacterium]|nr:PA2778 family cysteine peptidase [Gammaproteobacteria bacterium]